jgi:predicted  nucleic acid-binding Zn-ribbon protein
MNPNGEWIVGNDFLWGILEGSVNSLTASIDQRRANIAANNSYVGMLTNLLAVTQFRRRDSDHLEQSITDIEDDSERLRGEIEPLQERLRIARETLAGLGNA